MLMPVVQVRPMRMAVFYGVMFMLVAVTVGLRNTSGVDMVVVFVWMVMYVQVYKWLMLMYVSVGLFEQQIDRPQEQRKSTALINRKRFPQQQRNQQTEERRAGKDQLRPCGAQVLCSGDIEQD